MFKILAVLARASVFSFDHIKRDVLDELHRPDLMVDEQQGTVRRRKRTDHLRFPFRFATNLARCFHQPGLQLDFGLTQNL